VYSCLNTTDKINFSCELQARGFIHRTWAARFEGDSTFSQFKKKPDGGRDCIHRRWTPGFEGKI